MNLLLVFLGDSFPGRHNLGSTLESQNDEEKIICSCQRMSLLEPSAICPRNKKQNMSTLIFLEASVEHYLIWIFFKWLKNEESEAVMQIVYEIQFAASEE